MNLPDEIKTIDEFSEFTTVINKSSFIAQVFPIIAEKEIKDHLVKVRKKYYQASHHCYAFKLANGEFRYSDAGEPNGTAGIRILNAIDHFRLSNQLIIVSRIFGGIKLGVGPLGKTYYESAHQAITQSQIVIKHLYRKASITSSFEKVSHIHRILNDHKSLIISSDYSKTAEFQCLLKSNEIESISQKLTEISKSMITITIYDEIVYK